MLVEIGFAEGIVTQLLENLQQMIKVEQPVPVKLPLAPSLGLARLSLAPLYCLIAHTLFGRFDTCVARKAMKMGLNVSRVQNYRPRSSDSGAKRLRPEIASGEG